MRFRRLFLYPAMAALCLLALPHSATADQLFMGSAVTNEVYRYQISQFGSPTLNLTLSANLDRPAFLTVSPSGELFVANRGNPGGGSGSIARFLNPTGVPVANGTIADDNSVPGFDFNLPHDLDFRGNELFVVNSFQNNVLRFTFDAAGTALSNGNISDHLGGGLARGIAFDAAGNLFVSEANLTSLQLNQWQFNGAGAASFVREFSSDGNNDHGIAFAPWGELFVAAAGSNAIARVLFDGSGNPVANGLITGNSMNGPLDVTFSPWGELFVSNAGAAVVSRFTFDALHNAAANGTFNTPQAVAGLGFVQTATEQGDYNHDGKVDAADYALWRKNPSDFGGDPAGYNTWRANFGNGSGSGLTASSVPEPACVLHLIIVCTCGMFGCRIRRPRAAQRDVISCHIVSPVL